MKETSAILRVARKLDRDRAKSQPPRIDSFLDFLTHHARVKSGSSYVPYHFRGREALLPIVRQLDAILASGQTDASLALCGGAQFGKTVLMLNLLAYLVAVRFRNVGYYLPDDDLDQIPWLARLLTVGKTLAPSGRAVNRKGAFLCTDGERSALAFMRGLGKIPTSFSMDVVIQDEKDDLPEEHARFLSGRMTASDLRLSLIIGTQRYHGAGQNLAFTEGTQHIGLLTCPACARRHNPETSWPAICRLRIAGVADEASPRLTPEGHFAWADLQSGPHSKTSVILSEGEPNRPLSPQNPPEPQSKDLPLSPFHKDSGENPSPGISASRSPQLDAPSESAIAQTATKTGDQLPSPSRLSSSAHIMGVVAVILSKGEPARSVSSQNPLEPQSKDLPLSPFHKDSGENPSPGTSASRSPLATDSAFPIPFSPGQHYFLACPACGTELDRAHPEWHALAPERAAQRRWSYRLSQLLFPDIDLAQIVAAWQLAIRDPAHMNVFCTDRLALPKSSTQTLTPHDLQAARGTYVLGSRPGPVLPSPSADHLTYGGLDLGDQCWFVARTVDTRAPHLARLLWIEAISAERVRTRVPELFRELQLTALCVDAGPLRDLSRDLTFLLNDLDETAVATTDDAVRNIFFSHHGSTLPLRWHAASEHWQGVRCAPVEFTQREGQGLRHKVARTQDGRIYPLLAAHRDETIQRIITELLPAQAERPRLLESADGTATLAAGPRFLLPTATDETRAVLDLYERHLLAGARQERSPDGRTLRYLDQCENHFLLATAYAALAELLAPAPHENAGSRLPAFRALPARRLHPVRSVVG